MAKRKVTRESATVRVEIGQLFCGRSCGVYGPETGRVVAPKSKADDAGTGYAYGLPIWQVVGRQLGRGSIVEVTVRVLKEKPLKKNPWLFDARGRRIP